jgi:hypothetical protein
MFIVLILLSSPLIVNTVEYYQLKWTMILTRLNLIKFISLTCFSLLTCHGVRYLRKSHYMLCASDPLYFQKIADCKNMQMLLNCFACYEHSDCPKHVFIISLYIYDVRSNTCDLTPLYWYATVGDLRKLHLTYSPLLICYGRRSEETPSYLLPFSDMLR